MNQLGIVNAALGRLGVESIGNINDTTKAAKMARLFWDVALESVLRSENWARLITMSTAVSPLDIPWVATTAVNVGDIVATDAILYKCVRAGVTGVVPPSGYLAGVVDGSATWDAYDLVPTITGDYSYTLLYPENALRILSVGTMAYRVYGRFIYANESAPAITFLRKVATVDSLDAELQACVIAKLAEKLAPQFGQDKIVLQLIQEYEVAKRAALESSSFEVREAEPDDGFWTDKA